MIVPKRTLFWMDREQDAYQGCIGVVIPAEVITDEMSKAMDALSVHGQENEQNVRYGMWHWHWTVLNIERTRVQDTLTGFGLTETDNLDNVW